jgi:hypothetical protein
MCAGGGEAMGGIGLVTNMIGSYSQYQSQMQQATYQRQIAERQAAAYRQQADIARQNATIENKKAEIAIEKGADEIGQTKRKYAALTGAQRAAMGALGLTTSDGSPDKILDDTEMMLNLDIEAMRYNNRKTKWGYDINRVNMLNEAIMDESSAANALWAGDAQAAMTEYGARNTLLTGITSSLVDYGSQYGSSSKTKSDGKINQSYNRKSGYEGPKAKIIKKIPGWPSR